MEITAAIKGLQALTKACRVTVYSDSKLLVEAFNSGWIDNWQKNDFRQGKIKNIDLWREILKTIEPHQVEWVWVKGHQDDPLNNRCDRLARQAITDGVQAE